MLKLLKHCRIHTPYDLGIRDILIADERIAAIADTIPSLPIDCVEEIDCRGLLATPGFVDSHVHILGAGGNNGPSTRHPELMLSEFTRWGSTTVVGLLGADAMTRDLMGLLAKARALNIEGISTYIFIGAYDFPLPSFTGDLKKDIVMIPSALGIGEVAISDARSSQPTLQEITRIGADAIIAGRLAGRGGIVNIHVGPGKDGIKLLFEAVEKSNLPINAYLPTHCNRNSRVLDQMISWGKRGGAIDLTTNRVIPEFVWCPEAIRFLLSKDVPIERISMSTDAGGVYPNILDVDGNRTMGRWSTSGLYEEFKALVEGGLALPDAIQIVCTNPARHLGLYPQKGAIATGSDADIVLMQSNLKIDKVFARGRCMVEDGRPKVLGIFENSSREGEI